ncbi:hypothetical protein KR222_006144 [Zaprionus bogoriensis]|nr:hypothetical protein KR222_006144 [Zaprionus bogoriensis]
MLKALKADTFAGIANAKCGEVYFQSLHSYRIDCAFCDMKSFVFGDFLLHIQNAHFENGLLKSEVLELPKQEQPDSSQVNAFSWYEVPTASDALAENSESELAAGDEDASAGDSEDEEEVQDPVDVSIMKWDRDTSSSRAALRHTRALKVDYKEDSDMELNGAEDELQLPVPAKARKQPLSCAHCSKTYQSKKTLQRHMERQHKRQDNAEANAEAKPEAQAETETECTPAKLPAAYKCEHCDKVYQGKYTLRQHVKRDHDISVDEAFVCLECDAQLPRLRLLDEHVVQLHGGAPCVICGRRYKTRHELKRHQVKHTSERNVACSHAGCEKRFFTTRHMRNHSKVHTEQKNFVCESCGYSCRNKETLRVHARSHTGERPFGCQVCAKRFPSHSGLREHMAMHSTERPHVCKVCGATFSRQKGLYHHKFLHADKKQFVCKLCGNAYAQAAGLAGHMRKHRNDELNV